MSDRVEVTARLPDGRQIGKWTTSEDGTHSPVPASLSFRDLADTNRSRANRWHHGNMDEWSPSDWFMALVGEIGEAANVMKKIRRLEEGYDSINEASRHYTDAKVALAKVADELADSMIYLDLLATRLGIDLEAAVVAKFNQKSVEYGFPERLPSEPAANG